jgi:hypothetical protein
MLLILVVADYDFGFSTSLHFSLFLSYSNFWAPNWKHGKASGKEKMGCCLRIKTYWVWVPMLLSLCFFCLLGYDNLVHSNLFCFLTFVIFCSFTFYNKRLIIEMNKYFMDV